MTLEPRDPVTPNARKLDVQGVSSTTTARSVSRLNAQRTHSATPSEDIGHGTETPTNTVRSSRNTPPTVKQKRAKTTPLTSYGDLLRAAYGPVRRRWKPTHKEIIEIQTGPGLNSTERAQLLDLAKSDITLKRTRELMLFGAKRLDGPNRDRPVQGFVRDVLRGHPAYQSKSLKAALEHASVPLERHTVHVLIGETSRWYERSKLPKREANPCLVNALHCLLLWQGDSQSTPPTLQDVLRYLQEELWTSFSKRRVSEFNKFRALVGDRDPYATSIACSGLSGQILELRRQLNESRASTRQLQASLNEIKNHLQDTRDQLKDTTSRSTRLDRALGAARESHANEKAHLQDDFEKLRSSVARRLKAELSLLNDGLYALRRNPPKVSVMCDHAERAIDGLTREPA